MRPTRRVHTLSRDLMPRRTYRGGHRGTALQPVSVYSSAGRRSLFSTRPAAGAWVGALAVIIAAPIIIVTTGLDGDGPGRNQDRSAVGFGRPGLTDSPMQVPNLATPLAPRTPTPTPGPKPGTTKPRSAERGGSSRTSAQQRPQGKLKPNTPGRTIPGQDSPGQTRGAQTPRGRTPAGPRTPDTRTTSARPQSKRPTPPLKTPPSPPPQVSIIAAKLVSDMPGQCAVPLSLDFNAPVVQRPCPSDPKKRAWTLEPLDKQFAGTYLIHAVNTNLCLAAGGNPPPWGTAAFLLQCAPAANSAWTIDGRGYRLKLASAGLCMGLYATATNPNWVDYMFSCDPNKWGQPFIVM